MNKIFQNALWGNKPHDVMQLSNWVLMLLADANTSAVYVCVCRFVCLCAYWQVVQATEGSAVSVVYYEACKKVLVYSGNGRDPVRDITAYVLFVFVFVHCLGVFTCFSQAD